MPLFEGLSYEREKTAVVFDIGAAYTKCGFAGENGPRCIIPSRVKRPKTGEVADVHKYKEKDDLYGVLVDFIHVLYFRHLLVNPKERRVVVVESILSTTVFRQTLAKVLFKHYEIPSVLFAPGHLMSLFTLGIPLGLVLDSGYTETLVLPIYEGIPILKAWQALPLAAQSIHSYLEAQLMESATVHVGSELDKPLSAVTNSVDESTLEDIKVKCCFVTKLERAKQIHASHAGDETAQVPSPPPDLEYPMGGSKIMHVPGKIRENTCEVLFEQDNEERSVATLILDSILQCPLDIRRSLAENIVLVGGTIMLPGFKHRLMCELHSLLETPHYQHRLAIKVFKFHQPPAKENYVAWLGGAIFAGLEVLSSRSISREQYQLNPLLPDWCSLYQFEDKDDKGLLSKR